MKNKILILLFTILTTLLVFTLSINASEACTHDQKTVTAVEYADYAKAGTMRFTCPNCTATEMELEPLFTLSGYAISETEDGICAGYTFNNQVAQEISKLNSKLQLGVVIASKDLLGDKMPLDSKTAEPMELSNGATVLKIALTDKQYSKIDLVVKGFNESSYFKELYMSAYVFDGTQVKYVSSSTKAESAKISYAMLLNCEDVSVNGVKFSVFQPDSTIAADRQKQTNESKKEYNNPEYLDMTQSQLNTTKNEAGIIKLSSFLYPNGAAYMTHYLNGSGENYTIDMGTGKKGFFKTNETKNHRNTRITEAMRAAEQLAMEGGSIDVYQKGEVVNHFSNSTEDWRLAVGSYFTCINMLDVIVTVGADGTKTYTANVVYHVEDYYNWNKNDYNKQIKGLLPSPHDLHQLHVAGMAQEFTSMGTATYSITWTEGQSFSDVY